MWDVDGMSCEGGTDIIISLLRMIILPNKSSSLSSLASSLLLCSASLSALPSSSSIFISSCCLIIFSVMIEISFWALSNFVTLHLFGCDGPGWLSPSAPCWHSSSVALCWFCSTGGGCWATSLLPQLLNLPEDWFVPVCTTKQSLNLLNRLNTLSSQQCCYCEL